MNAALRIAAVVALIMLCTFLPFPPGRYDSLAVPLSSMAQVVGLLGLILVPVGVLCMVAKQRFFRVVAGVACAVVWGFISIVAMIQSGFALGIVIFALGIYVVWRASALPLDLIIVPIVVALVQYMFYERAIAFSRNTAIRNSAPIIAAIEQHRRMNGRYPTALHSVNPDYWPGVMGIPKYHYEPNGDAYNLFFEQFSNRLGTREFVMYNPRDEHYMTSHAADILELTPEQLQLDRTRGHNALNDAPYPHWKYFWFD